MTNLPVKTIRSAIITMLFFAVLQGGLPFLFMGMLSLDLLAPSKLHPTYEELDRRGYYAYIIPPSIVEQNGWKEDIFIWSWRRHCNIESSTRNNPLRITYSDQQENIIFRTEISPWGLIEWGPFQSTVKLPFDTQWAEPGTLEMFERAWQNGEGKTLYLRYKDWYGTPVYIVSQLPLTDTLTLLYTFRYVGAPPERAEPWERCERW